MNDIAIVAMYEALSDVIYCDINDKEEYGHGMSDGAVALCRHMIERLDGVSFEAYTPDQIRDYLREHYKECVE